MPSLNTGNAILSNAIAVNSSYNVGIGGAASGTNKLQVTGIASANSFIPTSSTVPSNGMYLPSANTLGFSTNGTLDMVINAAGNVAIGTSTPFNSVGYTVLDLYGSSVGGGHFLVRSPNVTAEYLANDILGEAYIGTRTNHPIIFRTNTTTRLTIAATGAATFSSSVTATNAVFERANDSGSILRIGNAGSTYFDFSRSASTGALLIQGNQTGNNNIILAPTSGNVGIGTNSPGVRLQVQGASTGTLSAVAFFNDNSSNQNGLAIRCGTGRVDLLATFAGSAVATDLTFTPTTVGGAQNEAMRITSGGRVCINTTSQIAEGRFNIVDNCNVVTPIEIKDTATTADGQFLIRFVNNSNSVCGSIAHNSLSSVAYNTTSDYRLKEDLKEIKGLEKVCDIKVYDYKWKDSESRMDGVLAHELQDVIPYAVTGEKDGEQMQGVDYSKLVPVLVKAIQELKAEINEQQQTINSLINR
jgi:hypothetical protein